MINLFKELYQKVLSRFALKVFELKMCLDGRYPTPPPVRPVKR